MEGAPDPTALHPVSGQERVVFLKPLVTDPRIEVGEYTYYDDPDDALAFEEKAFLYAHGGSRGRSGPWISSWARRPAGRLSCRA